MQIVADFFQLPVVLPVEPVFFGSTDSEHHANFRQWFLVHQIVADVFQLPVVLPVEPESAALGVALQAAAVHRGVPVAEFIAAAPPAVAEEVMAAFLFLSLCRVVSV